jgi:azurin
LTGKWAEEQVDLDVYSSMRKRKRFMSTSLTQGKYWVAERCAMSIASYEIMDFSKNKDMKVKTIYGTVEITPPVGYDESKIMEHNIIGSLEYKGFQADYEHGLEEDGEQNMYFGHATNLTHAAFIMQGDTLEELEDEFHGMVEDFLKDLSDPTISKPIEFYTKDQSILNYYYQEYLPEHYGTAISLGYDTLLKHSLAMAA